MSLLAANLNARHGFIPVLKLTIVMKNNAPFVATVDDLTDKTLVLPKGFAAHSYIKSLDQNFNIITTDTVFEALTLVSQGKADAFIGHFAVVIYQLERYFSQLSIVGLVEQEYSHRLILHKSNRVDQSSDERRSFNVLKYIDGILAAVILV